MDSYKIHIWSFIFGRAYSSTPTKVVKYLSKIKFNGESIFFTFDHIFQFILNCNKYDINKSLMCRIFTPTFSGQAKDWGLSLLVAYVDSWDEFAQIFLKTFQDYDCNQVCLKLENLCRIEGESYEDFILTFKLIFFKFQSEDLPSQLELIGWFRHILSLPCTNHNE